MFFWNKPKPVSSPPKEFFPWTPDLQLGIQLFDHEHRRMGTLINQLHALMVVQRDRFGANQLTDELIQVTRAHFASEEALLTQFDFPEREAHFQEHTHLIGELQDLQRQFKAGTLSALAMPVFLKKWLVDHIQRTDQLYVQFLKTKGIR